MQDGIDLCKRNIADFLADAKLIIAENRLCHALISVEFAIEELGKVLALRDAIKQNLKDAVKVEAWVFGGRDSHHLKSERVWGFLDPKHKTVFDEGVWDDEIWQHGMWLTNTKISHETRCDCAFVAFIGGKWLLGRDIKQERLVKLISHIEERLPEV